MNKKDEDKKSAELQVLDAKRYQKEKEKEAALKQKRLRIAFIRSYQMALTLMFWLWEIQLAQVLAQKQMGNSGLNSYKRI